MTLKLEVTKSLFSELGCMRGNKRLNALKSVRISFMCADSIVETAL